MFCNLSGRLLGSYSGLRGATGGYSGLGGLARLAILVGIQRCSLFQNTKEIHEGIALFDHWVGISNITPPRRVPKLLRALAQASPRRSWLDDPSPPQLGYCLPG